MKKQLLFIAALLVGGASYAQFTTDTEAEVGTGTTLYVVDSAAVNYSAVTGDGVTWDYSQVAGYDNLVRLVTMLDPASTTNGASFPNATHALEIENFLTTYTAVDGNLKQTHGFEFSDPNFGTVVAVMDEPASVMEFPFDLDDVIVDDYTGTTELPQIGPSTLEGNLVATVDGRGTLLLANGVEYSNVIRYKIQDTTLIDANLFVAELVREQYEYYDLSSSKFPLFIHSTGVLQADGLGELTNFNLVMSVEDPEALVNVSTVDLAKALVYPNPASDVLNLKLPQTPDANTTATLVDALGRTVFTETVTAAQTQLDVNGLRKGVYFLKVAAGSSNTTQRVIIK